MLKKIFLSLLATVALSGVLVPFVMAAEEKAGLDPSVKTSIAIAGGFGIAIAAFGGALSQGRAIAAGLEGIARNPGASGKILTPMIIGLAMIESLVIYTLVIALLLVLKL